ncbi:MULTISPECIES: hypothetical protein [Streptomyces]|uniref:hypothetical protein n=1 Tax=Streptomyces TaxID=1883 RepID=UPI001E2D8D8A|nr:MULTISPECIES: hypothetical protein [Streptomyces]UFQ16448.1 hypothetical protein J2N69_16345 [Streptomyces huasconensis]WCL86050.1 hypothetical protein PPN52_16355 [Streptomyces sp. JCM 35825]
MTSEELIERVEDAASLVKYELRFFGDSPESDAIDILIAALRKRLEEPEATMHDVAKSQGTSLDEMRTWWHWNS